MHHAFCNRRIRHVPDCADSAWMLASLLAMPLLLCGCAYHLNIGAGATPAAPPAADQFTVGAAKIDITPHIGIPMGNYAEQGVWAHGTWTHLFARAIYIQDADKHAITLVSCDLGAIPAGLGDRVAELLAHDVEPASTHLGREQLVISATGTHHGPSNFSSTEFYNGGNNLVAGFDPALHDFLAGRIAVCVRHAFASRTGATIAFSQIRMRGVYPPIHAHNASHMEDSTSEGNNEIPLLANRSPLAFLRNGDSETIQRAASAGPTTAPTVKFPYITAYRAVVPTVAILSARRKADALLIGVAAFLAVQSPSLSRATNVYSSELLGAAAIIAEQRMAPDYWGGSDGGSPVVAIFNGAQADVVTTADASGRNSTLRYANRIADSIMSGADNVAASILPAGRKRRAGALADLADRTFEFTVTGDIQYCFARKSLIAAKTVPRPTYPGEPFLQTIFSCDTYPQDAPLGVYRIGDAIVIATLPGEFTTMMGQRVREALVAALPVPTRPGGRSAHCQVLLAGMSNEYASYFATPEEYAAHSYEGMWSLYGASAGEHLKATLSQLAANLAAGPAPAHSPAHTYIPGIKRSFGMGDLDMSSGYDPEDLSDIFPGDFERLPERIQCCEWEEFVAGDDRRPLPRVAIGAFSPDAPPNATATPDWTDSDDGMNFLVICTWHYLNQSTWRAYWLPPHGTVTGFHYKFTIHSMDNSMHTIDARDAATFGPP